MSAPDASEIASASQRVLSFEVGGTVYALPITEVLEVTEQGRVTCIPTLAPRFGGVMNWHGDAIPVVAPWLLFGGGELDEDGEPRERRAVGDLGYAHVLVVSGRSGESARLGVPIERVMGLADGPGSGPVRSDMATPRGPLSELVVERRPVDGRIVNMLDPRSLVARAEEVIEKAVSGTAWGGAS